MGHKILVSGIKLYAYHGCLPQEAEIGGNYIVDVELVTDFSAACTSDKLEDTVDYVLINKIVQEEMAIRAKLIEVVGKQIIERIKKEASKVLSVKVQVTKLSPPINGDVDSVSIIIEE